tara:strand:- start:27 stop:1445 length:1419 start_codon:yes stop_codon:yes gene_type:complete
MAADDKTAKQEKASLIAFYYAIEKGSNLGTLNQPATGAQARDEHLYKALLEVYPDMLGTNSNNPDYRWYNAFLKQAIVFIDWLGHKQGSTDSSYRYGRFGSNSVKGIPSSSTAEIGDKIWDEFFTKDQQKLFGSGSPKKDSWNPMDVYIVKKSDEAGLIKEIKDSCCFQDRIAPDVEAAAMMEVQGLNHYLAHYTKQRKFVGVSLKETDSGDPKVTETNLEKTFDHIEHSCGMITKKLNMNMTLLGSKTKVKKGEIIDKGMDFQSNSLTYEGQFIIGDNLKNYKYESKISSVENHATEPRDRVSGARGGLTNAKARNGAVPVPKMAKIVKQYSGQKINADIPLKGNFTPQNKTAMVKLLTDIKKGGGQTQVQAPFAFNIHLNRKAGKWWSNMSATEYVDKLVELDNEYKKKTDKFPKALRSKFRAARYIYMFQEAERDSNHKLSQLIAELYFASSKINISKNDLSGPFIKIQ